MTMTVKNRSVILSAAALMCATPAFAHEVSENVTPGNLWSAWTWEPGIVIPIALSIALYLLGLGALKSRGSTAVSVWQIASFFAGSGFLIIALVSPLHALGSELFSAHMTQHEV